MALSIKDKEEVQRMVNDSLKKALLRWEIVQNLPETPVKNTLYFLQVSISPRLFKLYHTDKDGDIAELQVQSTP